MNSAYPEKLKCCTNQFPNADTRATRCHPSDMPQSFSCDAYMTQLCQSEAGRKAHPEHCSCFYQERPKNDQAKELVGSLVGLSSGGESGVPLHCTHGVCHSYGYKTAFMARHPCAERTNVQVPSSGASKLQTYILIAAILASGLGAVYTFWKTGKMKWKKK